MQQALKHFVSILLLAIPFWAQAEAQWVEIPTRPGVTQGVLTLSSAAPKAAVIIFAGGHGGLQISPDGSFAWGKGNFLVRTRQLFADQGLFVVIVDAPSDRQTPPFLSGFRQTPEHQQDIQALISWVRHKTHLPIWLIGTSRGTQSAAHLAIQLAGPEGPDGLVLTSSILSDNKGRPVPAMALEQLRIPTLVIHHEADGCAHCAFAEIPALMAKLEQAPRKQLLSFTGGISRGDPCEAFAHHGFNGQEAEVVKQISAWILAQ